MPKIKYVERNFGEASLATIARANEIIATYTAQGYKLTLRQLYYQFVSRDWIPNKVTEYKRLGSIINDARLAGLIDWSAIEDRTRNLASLSHWDTPGDIIASASNSFRIDRWEDQPNRVEVWIEKEALAGVFERVCEEFDVPFLCCRGYTSQSEMWGGAMRLLRHAKGGQKPLILHFGDHDPSGIDMTRDIKDRLYTFGCRLKLDRLALNMDQVEQYNPPPNPAKETDSRFAGYIQEYGDKSWELDALEPQVLAQLVRDALTEVIDKDEWDNAESKEENGKKLLNLAAENWDDVAAEIEDRYGDVS
jgi:hypothetical protein